MQQSIPMRDTGSTRGFTTVDPERQGVLVGMMRPIQAAPGPVAKPALQAGTRARVAAAQLAKGSPDLTQRAR